MNNFDRSWTEIDLDNFQHNLQELKKFIPENKTIMQIVKADAYGHGAYRLAKKAIECGARMLGIANADEGRLLRYKQITVPILILSPSLEAEIDMILEHDLTPTISSLDFAYKLNEKAKIAGVIRKVHVNFDSGMGRSGITLDNAPEFLADIAKLNFLKIEGIFSHFAASENDPAYTAKQSRIFQDFLAMLDFRPDFIHIANSSAVVQAEPDFTNLVRLGLLTYGVYTDSSLISKIDLKPVMTFKSYIIQIKTAKPGDSIGYNRTHICQKKTKYAIIPVGYADGYDFLLSNQGKVIINNQTCQLIGKISMDMITVDITDLKNVNVLDEAILLGGDHSEVRAEYLTRLYGGSSYEILCQIGRRAKRYFLENGKFIDSSPLLRRDFVSYDYPKPELNTIIETAIEQRLQDKEIASTIYNDFLERFITEKDLNIQYRTDFRHHVSFKETHDPALKDYYFVETTLKFYKVLKQEYFYIACAQNETDLEKYFQRKDVEYRWLLDDEIDLSIENFQIPEVKINDLELAIEIKQQKGCLEIHCSHPKLTDLIDQKVEFSISTATYYPKKYQQLTIYINEMTRGVEISFDFAELFEQVEAIPVFSGRNKFPELQKNKDRITARASMDEWIFPLSGIVFVYR